METVLVTGANGVIGSVLCRALESAGWAVRKLDIAVGVDTSAYGDIRDARALARAVQDCAGVIHLAAVSRVGWAEDDPERCRSVNVEGTRSVVSAAMHSRLPPWLLFVSSREVYGNPARLPVVEDDPIGPVNCYGRSKAEGERIVSAARGEGLRTATLRLPSIYGSPDDIPDRAAPAFALRALKGEPLYITGTSQVCDFLYIDDAVQGLCTAARMLADGRSDLPTIHLATGRATTLGELAELAKRSSHSASAIVEEPRRSFDVLGFVGDPARALALLGWAPSLSLEQGMSRLVSALAARQARERCRGRAE